VSPEIAVAHLASRPKPLWVRVQPVSPELVLEVLPLPPPDQLPEQAREAYEFRRDDGNPLAFLTTRYPGLAEDLTLACGAAGEVVSLTVGEFKAWRRSYFLDMPFDLGVAFTDSSYPAAQGYAPEQVGTAVAFLSFVDQGWAVWRPSASHPAV
jgi:hypothetical protein